MRNICYPICYVIKLDANDYHYTCEDLGAGMINLLQNFSQKTCFHRLKCYDVSKGIVSISQTYSVLCFLELDMMHTVFVGTLQKRFDSFYL